MFKYAVKRVSKSGKLFAALLVATTLGATFFAGVSISSDVISRQAVNMVFSYVPVDFNARSYYSGPGTGSHSQGLTDAAQSFLSIADVNGSEVISRSDPEIKSETVGYTTLVGMQSGSLFEKCMKIESGDATLGANETYIWAGSPDLGTLGLLGSTITLNYSFWGSYPYKHLLWNLTVKGIVSMSDRGLAIARGELTSYYSLLYPQYASQYYNYPSLTRNILIVDWEKTCSKIVDKAVSMTSSYYGYPAGFDNSIIISIDRNKLVSPYNIEGAIQSLAILNNRIQNHASVHGMSYVEAHILSALNASQFALLYLRFSFLVIAMAIFFLAWFMGGAASAVSFNLRRREIGLLSTRGFTSRSINRLFITESVIIGLIAGLIGFVIGTLMVPIMLGLPDPLGFQTLAYVYSNAGLVSVILTVVFGVLLSVFTVFRAAKKAANVKTIDALKEYTLVEESQKPHRSKLVLIAFILGTYKMVIWLSGLNLFVLFQPFLNNLVMFIAYAVLASIDGMLNTFGPLLFLYGTVKLTMQFAPRLQRKIGSLGRRAFKDAGMLATKNVQRNPARNVTVAFIIALVLGYGVFVIGLSASNNDYAYRSVYADVGADVSAYVAPLSNITYLSNATRSITGVSDTALERWIYGSSSVGGMTLRAIDPVNWSRAAYYESEWIRGTTVEQAIQSMLADNFTIVLDSTVAKPLGLKVGDGISISVSTTSGEKYYTFRVIGFFGPEPPETSAVIGPYYYYYYGTALFRSYIPMNAANQIGAYSNYIQLLLKLGPAANATYVVNELNRIENVSNARAASAALSSRYSNPFLTGPENLTNVAVAFAVVGVSLETSIIVLITLFERRKELAMLSVRGMSSKQIFSILLLESITIVGFALALGTLVGLIMVLGGVKQSDLALQFTLQLVTHRVVFPLESTLLIVGMISLVLLAVIIPTFVAAKRAPSSARGAGRLIT